MVKDMNNKKLKRKVPNSKSSKKENISKKNIKANPSSTFVEGSSVVQNLSLENEVINLPVYSSAITKDNEIDSFIVDIMRHADKEDIKPFFIGQYNTTSYEMHIKNSSTGTTPSDLIEDDLSNDVVNLRKLGS